MPLHRRVPKRGFHNPFRVEYAVVNLDTLAEVFDAGTVGDAGAAARARPRAAGARRRSRCSAAATSAKKLTVHAHKFSGSAAEKIAAAGGTAEVLWR